MGGSKRKEQLNAVGAAPGQTAVKPPAATPQVVADALMLIPCVFYSDHRLYAVAACFGSVVPFIYLLLALFGSPSFFGAGGCVVLLSITLGYRIFELSRPSLPNCTSRATSAPSPEKVMRAATFVPEAWLRWMMLGTEPVTAWTSPSEYASQLLVTSIPTPSLIRKLSSDRSTSVEVINICQWWSGYRPACEQLRLVHEHSPPSRVYAVDVAERLAQKLSTKRTAPFKIVLYCESGEMAAAVAAGALVLLDGLDACTAAKRVCDATKRRLACRESQCAFIAELVLSACRDKARYVVRPKNTSGTSAVTLQRGTPAVAAVAEMKHVPKVTQLSGGKSGDGAVPHASAAGEGQPATMKGGSGQRADDRDDHGGSGGGGDDDEDDGGESESDSGDEYEHETEQERIRRNYQEAVARFGLPGANGVTMAPVGASEADAGWSTAVKRRPTSSASSRPTGAAAVLQGYANVASGRKATESEALTKKQRANRRKAEKARMEREELRELARAAGPRGPTL